MRSINTIIIITNNTTSDKMYVYRLSTRSVSVGFDVLYVMR